MVERRRFLGLGDGIRVQSSTWNCALLIYPNPHIKPWDDVRARQALNLALDRWQASRTLSRIAIMKTPGQAVFPGHPLGLTQKEMEQLPGYSRDIKASRAKARRLLKEAGADDIRVVAGGVMPDEDAAELKKQGVAEVLFQDTPPDEIVSTLRQIAAGRGAG